MAGGNPGNMMLKQYLRWLPAQLGLFDKGAFLLQIDRILPDDIYIASYPKSGNTWLRFVMANMKSKGEEITFRNIDEYVPDIYSAKNILNAQGNGRIIKTHQALFEHYPKTIYIYRDYRDVLISFYHYEKALNHFSGTLQEFISSKNVMEPFGSWKKHVSDAFAFQKQHPERILILSYEAMHSDPVEHIRKLIEFYGLQPVLGEQEIKERCEFSKLRAAEDKFGSEFKEQSQQNFFREGKKGGWKEVFTNEMNDLLKKDKELVGLMTKLGYIIG